MKILNYILLFAFSFFASPLFGKSILEMYRGSVQEKMLDEQIARYRKHAKMNAETFGRHFKHLPNYDRHVGLEKLRRVLPNHANKDNIPAWRTTAGSKQPHPKLNDVSRIKKSAYK
jgi:hypothetical protein